MLVLTGMQACIFDKRRKDIEYAQRLKSDTKSVRKKAHNWIPVSPGCSRTQSVNLHENAEEVNETKSTEIAMATTEGGAERKENAVDKRPLGTSKEEEEISTIVAEDIGSSNEISEVECKKVWLEIIL